MAKKRRIRSPHPGVKLKARKLLSGRLSWRAHFKDPDTGREVAITLDPSALRTKEARRQWAIQKSQELSRIRMDRANGTRAPTVGPTILEAIDVYLGAARQRLEPRTVAVYETAIGRLRSWAAKVGKVRTTDLGRADLVGLRDYLIALPRSGVRGGPRSTRQPKAKSDRRSPVTVNTELRSLKTILVDWHRREFIPQLPTDDIRDALHALPVDREAPLYLSMPELRKLLEAALRHDATTFDMTRAEHRGARSRGTTQRYDPIAPFVAFVLLSGCRRGEALGLRWDMVHLDALNYEGAVVGEIKLPARGNKTRRARSIGLDVSPALRRLLLRLKLRARGDFVFGGNLAYTSGTVISARRRLIDSFGAPAFDWQLLRSTCSTYLTNAPGIFGATTAHRSANQLGHSVEVAQRHYVGLIRGIPLSLKTLEATMGIERELAAVIEVVGGVAMCDAVAG